MEEPTKWASYEEVAAYLLNRFRDKFGLESVEQKQSVQGNKSGTTYEIDAKGISKGNEGFVIIECRRYTKSRQNQEKIGSLAYRILDTGASGGILVSPLGMQEGASKIAATENIVSVILDEQSTKHSYVLKFLNEVMIGLPDQAKFNSSIQITRE